MEQMFQYLGGIKGCTVPQALRLAMLRLARRPALDQPVSEQDVADGLQQAWKRPMHWAGFLVMGASTFLPRGGLGRPKKAEEWSVDAVCDMVHWIGFAGASNVLEENLLE